MSVILEEILNEIEDRRPDLLGRLVAYDPPSTGRYRSWVDAFDGAMVKMQRDVEDKTVTTAQARFAGCMCLFSIPLKVRGRVEKKQLTVQQVSR